MKKYLPILSVTLMVSLLSSGCFIFRQTAVVSEIPAVTDTVSTIIQDTGMQDIVDSLKVLPVDTLNLLPADSLIVIMDSLTAVADSLEIISPDLPDTITLVMVGDVMLGTDYPNKSYLPPNSDCWPLLSPLANDLGDADISFCNLEGVFAGTHGTPKGCRDPKTCYVFRMPEAFSSCIKQAGFDVVSVANNHVNDFGYGGRLNTIKVLNEEGIHFAGFAENPYTIFESNGLLIGFCAFSPNRGVKDLRNISEGKELVSMLADTCDLVLVSMHGGAEGSKYQHVTRQKEVFLGADRGNVHAFAHSMIDAGADVIIGHGPHVTRAIETYEDRFIAYSLGNFATYGRFNISGANGIAPLIKIWITPEGEFIKGKIIPTMQTGRGGTIPDPNNRVILKIRDLCKMDFPESKLTIDDGGNIRKKE